MQVESTFFKLVDKILNGLKTCTSLSSNFLAIAKNSQAITSTTHGMDLSLSLSDGSHIANCQYSSNLLLITRNSVTGAVFPHHRLSVEQTTDCDWREFHISVLISQKKETLS